MQTCLRRTGFRLAVCVQRGIDRSFPLYPTAEPSPFRETHCRTIKRFFCSASSQSFHLLPGSLRGGIYVPIYNSQVCNTNNSRYLHSIWKAASLLQLISYKRYFEWTLVQWRLSIYPQCTQVAEGTFFMKSPVF